MRLLARDPAPLLIGLVLGPLLETYLRRSLIVSTETSWRSCAADLAAGVLLLSAIILPGPFAKSFQSKAAALMSSIHLVRRRAKRL